MGVNIAIDARTGGAASHEVAFGEVTIEATMLRQDGAVTVLPAPTRVGLAGGKATLVNVSPSPEGPEPAWAYYVTIKDHVSGRTWRDLVGVPDVTGTVPYPSLPRFITSIPPNTTPDQMQNWADTARDSASQAIEAMLGAQAPTDQMVSTLLEVPSETQAAADARYAKRGELEFNVRDFGAVGDGTTDEQAAVEACIAAAAGTFGQGGKVVFPPGEYTWQVPVRLSSNLHIDMTGASLVKRTAGGYAAFFAILSGSSQGYGSGARNISFKGGRVEGSFAIGRQATLLAANHGSGVRIEDIVFSQCQVYGHTLDLQGCDDVKILDCTFEGQLANPNYVHIECIQVDNSTLVGSSFPDDPASYDGLPTIDVTVERCKFIPLTVGDVTHPAPNPIGSHSGVEGMMLSGVNFNWNTVHVGQEQTAGTHRGAIHFVNLKDSTIGNNVFINDTGAAVSAIALRPMAAGYTLAEVSLPSPSTSTWQSPQACSNVKMPNNKFVGFNSRSLTEHVVSIMGHATRYAEGITVTNPIFQDCYGGSIAENVSGDLIYARYARSTRIRDLKSDKCRRAVNFVDCDDMVINAPNIKNASGGGGGAINGVTSTAVTITNLQLDGWRAYGVYLQGVVGISVARARTKGASAGAAVSVNLSGCSRFSVDGTDASGGTRGVVIHSASTAGQVSNTIASVSDVPVAISADSPTVTQSNNIAA